MPYNVALKEHKLGTPPWHFPSALLQLSNVSTQEFKHSSGAPVFAADTQSTPQTPCLWWPVRVRLTHVAPQDHIYLHAFKAAA